MSLRRFDDLIGSIRALGRDAGRPLAGDRLGRVAAPLVGKEADLQRQQVLRELIGKHGLEPERGRVVCLGLPRGAVDDRRVLEVVEQIGEREVGRA